MMKTSPESVMPTAFVGIVASIISLLRLAVADPRWFQSIWAEDGWIPLCVVNEGHGSCIGNSVNGYWPVVHRLVAEPLALLPMSTWPFVFPVMGAISVGLLCAAVYRYTSAWSTQFVGLLCALGVVLAPVLGIEFLNVFGNILWILLAVAMLIVAFRGRELISSPQSLLLLFVAALSNPAGFVLVGMLLLVVVMRMSSVKELFRPLFFACIGWVIQLAAILRFGGDERVGSSLSIAERIEGWAGVVVGIVPGVTASRESSTSLFFSSSRLTPLIVVLVTIGMLALVSFGNKSSEAQKKFSILGFGVQGLTGFLLLTLDENPRYAFVLVAMNLVWIVGLFSTTIKVGPFLKLVLISLIVVAPLAGFKAGSYRITPSALSWQEQLEAAREDCSLGGIDVEVFFAPGRTYLTKVKCEVFE